MENTEIVRDRLIEALATLTAVWDWRTLPSSFGDYWQPTIDSLLTTAGLFQAAASRQFPTPSAERIARAVEALSWLGLLPGAERQIVTGLCAIPPGWHQPVLSPAMLATGLRLDKEDVKSRFDRGIRFIAFEVGVIAPAELPAPDPKKRRSVQRTKARPKDRWAAV